MFSRMDEQLLRFEYVNPSTKMSSSLKNINIITLSNLVHPISSDHL